ncbi:MAG: hypothetical protein ACK4IU_02160 [Tabrizicola flagellatus]|uniref:hypothetical protein n=1 Tax=Tabrizicola flagellatus TaxID=2593021 RepID=UPI00391D4418
MPGTPLALQGSVGVVVDGDPYGLGLFEYPDLCQRLLLTGIAERVILAHADRVPEVPAPDRYATIWRMERRGICPAVSLNTNSAGMVIPGEPKLGPGTRPVDLMYLEIAAGNCLIREEGSYGRPDFTLLDVHVAKGPAQGRRSALIRHDGAADVIVAQQTVATGNVVGPPLLPVPELSMDGPSGTGLWRQSTAPDGTAPGPVVRDFATFLTGTLGLDLALVTEGSGQALRDQVSRILDQPGEVADSADPLIASYLQSFAFGTMTDPADQDILLRIFARPEISLPFWTSTGLPTTAPENAAFYGKVADLTFARLPLAERDFSTGEAVDGLIDRLPADILRDRKDVVLRLAADPSVRFLNSRIVSRLSDLGAEAGPVLLDVLSEPPPEGGGDLAYFRHEAWSDQRLWSFAALCKGGPVFAGLKPNLQALIEAKVLDVRSLIGLRALVRVGFTLEELEGLLSTFGPDLASTLDQASKDSADCWP